MGGICASAPSCEVSKHAAVARGQIQSQAGVQHTCLGAAALWPTLNPCCCPLNILLSKHVFILRANNANVMGCVVYTM